MKKIVTTLLACTATLSLAAAAAGTDVTTYRAEKNAAASDYNAAKAKCGELSGNAKDVCIQEAQAAKVQAVSESTAQYKDTDKARANARIDVAEAEYDVAKAKCSSLKGNEKDVCIKEAKAAKVAAVSDAKADKKISKAVADANENVQDANKDLAVEKCKGLSGDVKDSCITTAKREAAAAATPTAASDTVITAKVKADLLKEPGLKSLDIHVETMKGVVQLSGFVNADSDAAKATELARGVKGVVEVRNDIKLK